MRRIQKLECTLELSEKCECSNVFQACGAQHRIELQRGFELDERELGTTRFAQHARHELQRVRTPGRYGEGSSRRQGRGNWLALHEMYGGERQERLRVVWGFRDRASSECTGRVGRLRRGRSP